MAEQVDIGQHLAQPKLNPSLETYSKSKSEIEGNFIIEQF
jgi:hypothetical protein